MVNGLQNDSFLKLGNKDNKEVFKLKSEVLKKHFVALGSSGSGKTVLCKSIIEEAALLKIPSIIVDPQGDLASLAIMEDDTQSDIKERFSKEIRVTIFTPTSSKGIPICINPLKLPKSELENEDKVSIINQISNAICKLVGYDLEKDDGKSAQAVLFLIFDYCYKNKIELKNFDNLIDIIKNIPEKIKTDVSQFIDSKQDFDKLIKKVKFLTIGEKELLFEFGVPLDIPILLGIEDNNNKKENENKKTQISVIYLNTLESAEDKEFFVSMLATKLYEWMLSNPKKDVQALFYIDEISTFLPAGAIKPISKPILTLLYKQARKYGVSCLMSTQNPGDVDYKAFSQIGTWAIGRLTTDQDREKVKDALKSISKDNFQKEITENLPSLQPGNFILFCPDMEKNIIKLKVRKIYTKHLTLTEKDVKDLTTEELRKHYGPFFIQKNKNSIISNQKIDVQNWNEEVETKSTSLSGFHPKLYLNKFFSEKKAIEIIKKKIEQKLPLFSSKKTIAEIKLILEPIICAKVKKSDRNLFLKKIKSYEIFFDLHSYNFVDILKNKKYFGIKEMLNLENDEIKTLQEIIVNGEISISKLMARLEFDNKRIQKALSNLKKSKLITSQIYSNQEIFTTLFDLVMPSSLTEIDQKSIKYDSSLKKPKEEAKMIKQDIDKISRILNCWYKNCEIVESCIVYCPVFEAKIIDEKGREEVAFLNAYNGKMVFSK